jgi:hypothetical protein
MREHKQKGPWNQARVLYQRVQIGVISPHLMGMGQADDGDNIQTGGSPYRAFCKKPSMFTLDHRGIPLDAAVYDIKWSSENAITYLGAVDK